MGDPGFTEIRFILDVHLGKLAKYLRLLGFDSLMDKDLDDNGIIERAIREKRVILSRDKLLMRNKLVINGHCITSSKPVSQLEEVVQKFDLSHSMNPFTRCTVCNMVIEPVDKEKIIGLIPPKTRKYYDDFLKCTGCGRIYWKGSHYEKMMKLIKSIAQEE
jgi:uncharacterized protein with PIN domain